MEKNILKSLAGNDQPQFWNLEMYYFQDQICAYFSHLLLSCQTDQLLYYLPNSGFTLCD